MVMENEPFPILPPSFSGSSRSVDVGNVFGENERIKTGELRASVGLGVSWISPLGPLRIAAAQPVRKFAGDRIQKLQFQIGTSF